ARLDAHPRRGASLRVLGGHRNERPRLQALARRGRDDGRADHARDAAGGRDALPLRPLHRQRTSRHLRVVVSGGEPRRGSPVPSSSVTPRVPAVAVLLTVYDGAKYRERLWASLSVQIYPRERWRLIVVDNGPGPGVAGRVARRPPDRGRVVAGADLR